MRKRLKMSIFRRSACVGLTAVMATTFIAGQALAFADNNKNSVSASSGVSFENVTGKIDLTEIKLDNMNKSVVMENDTSISAEDMPEYCTVIVSLDGQTLTERAGGEKVSDYITTDAGKNAVREIESEQNSFLSSLKKAKISYELVGT